MPFRLSSFSRGIEAHFEMFILTIWVKISSKRFSMLNGLRQKPIKEGMVDDVNAGLCLCGSGRAYRDCCWTKDCLSPAVAASVELGTEAKRHLALVVRLGEWAIENPQHLLLQVAVARYFYLSDYTDAERQWVGELYTHWLLHDFEIGREVTVASCVLEERGAELSAWERQGIERIHRQICGRREGLGLRLVEVTQVHGDQTVEVEDLRLDERRTVGTQCLDDPPGVGDVLMALIWPVGERAELLAASPVPAELAPVLVQRLADLFREELDRMLHGDYSHPAAVTDPGAIVDVAEENVFRYRAPQVIHAVVDAGRALAAWDRIRPREQELVAQWAEEELRLEAWSSGEIELDDDDEEPKWWNFTVGHYRVLDHESLLGTLDRNELFVDWEGGPRSATRTYFLQSMPGTEQAPSEHKIADVLIRGRHMWVSAYRSTFQLRARRIILEVVGAHVEHVLDERLEGGAPLSGYLDWQVLGATCPAVGPRSDGCH